jgi:sigma-E factor negative regulatory protein RseB
MRSLSIALLLSGSLVLPAHALEASDWLLRLAHAEQHQSFNGTFVYERSGSFSTHRIWHRVGEDGSVQEHLLQLDGPEQEVLRVNDQVQCLSGGLALQVASGSWSARTPSLDKLQQWYDLRLMGDSRVAGRSAVVIAVVPRDQHRLGFELHLDRETGLPLKSLLLNEKGQQLERFQFTSFDNAPFDQAKLTPSADCKAPEQGLVAKLNEGHWRSEWLPPGFALEQMLESDSSASAESVSSIMYGDGLARFSVFLEPLGGVDVEEMRSQLGPTVAVSKRISTEEGDVMVTVVGEIPLGTAERVALSMRTMDTVPVQ